MRFKRLPKKNKKPEQFIFEHRCEMKYGWLCEVNIVLNKLLAYKLRQIKGGEDHSQALS